MAIPDPTVDPVTGLPILDTSGIVQQIPLGNQTVDFPSWNASAQPTRSPIFPDDGFPMFANVQGQDPLTNNAQSVQTDGNRALKVSVVNGGGGGINWNYTTGYQADSANGAGLGPFDTIDPAPKILYSFTGAAYADVVNQMGGAIHGMFTIGYSDYNNQGAYPLFTGILSFDPTYPNYIQPNVSWRFEWPSGLPILGTFDSSDKFTIWTNCPSFHTYVTYTLLYA